MRVRLSILVSALLATCWLPAQSVPVPGKRPLLKAENGLIMDWNVITEDRTTPQVWVYDGAGKLLVELAPLRLVPEAKDATVHDVSALPGRMIAMEVTYRKAPGTVPAGSLLGFDFKGNPLFAVALAPSRGIWRLTVDADLTVWTLANGSGVKGESDNDPMIVGYSPSGDVFKEMLKRSEFPLHASGLQENPAIGVSGLGHTVAGVWFWLPGSTDLVTFKPDGSSLDRTVTGLPQGLAGDIPIMVLRSDAGDLLMQISGSPQRYAASFLLRAGQKNWQPVDPPCDACRLIGIDKWRAVFAKPVGNEFRIYKSPLPD